MTDLVANINRVLASALDDAPSRYSDVIRFIHPRRVDADNVQLDFMRGNNVSDVEYRDALEWLLVETDVFAIASYRCVVLNDVENTATIVLA